MAQLFECVACRHELETDALDPKCDSCGSAVLLVVRDAPTVSRGELDALPAGVWRYGRLLPWVDPESVVSLGEGGTPLLRASRLGEELGLRKLLIKDESRNPTGSFLDRGATVLLSLAKQRRIKECECLTTGNLGASLAAYCAKAGVEAHIRINPNIDRGKLYQMLAYGAHVGVPGSRLSENMSGMLAVTAGNPYLIEGEKTTGFEMAQDLGWRVPDVVVVPVGTGGHLSTIWRSLTLLKEMRLIDASECRLLGVQVKGGPASGPNRAAARSRFPRDPEDFPLTELEESIPYFAHEAARAVDESGGTTLVTGAVQTIESTKLLAATEGIFAEPSSASVVAAVRDAVQDGLIKASETVVCVVTGAGLKDTKAVARLAREARRGAVGEAYAFPSSKIGDTKLALLRLLKERPSYGYELWLAVGTGRKISTASIYQHLSELEGFSLVRKTGTTLSKGRERVIYELTRRGADFLKISSRLEQQGAPG